MVNINEEFPSKYLKSADLQGTAQRVKIRDVVSEDIGGDRKLIIYFAGKQKGMVLNKTNARTIADVFGDETDNWITGEIEVFAMKVDFQGRMVDGLRVRVPRPSTNKTSAVPAYGSQRGEAPAPAAAPAGPIDLDDEIPFAPEWR
jgi:hypothetical protein